jgi:hypothetical protein
MAPLEATDCVRTPIDVVAPVIKDAIADAIAKSKLVCNPCTSPVNAPVSKDGDWGFARALDAL